MKLDVEKLSLLSHDEVRVLQAVEVGSKSHEYVPVGTVSHICQQSKLKRSLAGILMDLCRSGFLEHKHLCASDCYKMTFSGFDTLALDRMRRHCNIRLASNTDVGCGKESRLFLGKLQRETSEGGQTSTDGPAVSNGTNDQIVALKVHRLGQCCFSKARSKRDYYQNKSKSGDGQGRKSKSRFEMSLPESEGTSLRGHRLSWMEMSRLSAFQEFKTLTKLYEAGVPVPKPLGVSMHVVAMEYVPNSVLLNDIGAGENCLVTDPVHLRTELFGIIEQIYSVGLVHADFNEFNILVSPKKDSPSGVEVYAIDVPQAMELGHPSAGEFLERDVSSINDFFSKKFRLPAIGLTLGDKVYGISQSDSCRTPSLVVSEVDDD